ncbi:SbmA/BacA-like family transporter [Vogesella fluminis]|uniref:SbmA/BacA-like family transporter n=1 Tax=Vogesella fluminis TaxID=1069161 RepID=UPI003643F968
MNISDRFGYWRDVRGRGDVLLLGLATGLAVAGVYLGVELNRWSGNFYNALQVLDADKTYALLGNYLFLLAGIVVSRVAVTYLKECLALRWRVWLTGQMLGRWLNAGRHYRLEAMAGHDNPDQRVAEDAALFSRGVLDTGFGLLSSLLSLLSFGVILWQLSASMPLPGVGASVPGYLVWACVIYTLAGTLVTHWLGAELVDIQFGIQRKEAEFRRVLLGQRAHAESISFQRAEQAEQVRAMACMYEVAGVQSARIRKEKASASLRSHTGKSLHWCPSFCDPHLFVRKNAAGWADADQPGICAGEHGIKLVYFCV